MVRARRHDYRFRRWLDRRCDRSQHSGRQRRQFSRRPIVNPFDDGYLQLTDDGSGNALIQLDAAGNGNWVTILILEGVDPADLTTDNFGGVALPSTAPIDVTLDPGTNFQEGTVFDDTIVGNDNGDKIITGPGSDSVTGGAGNDTVFGLGGRDTYHRRRRERFHRRRQRCRFNSGRRRQRHGQ